MTYTVLTIIVVTQAIINQLVANLSLQHSDANRGPPQTKCNIFLLQLPQLRRGLAGRYNPVGEITLLCCYLTPPNHSGIYNHIWHS